MSTTSTPEKAKARLFAIIPKLPCEFYKLALFFQIRLIIYRSKLLNGIDSYLALRYSVCIIKTACMQNTALRTNKLGHSTEFIPSSSSGQALSAAEPAQGKL
jgi:hypothetical protein